MLPNDHMRYRNASYTGIQQLTQLVNENNRQKWIQPSVKKIVGIKKNSSIDQQPLCEVPFPTNLFSQYQESQCDLSYSNRSNLQTNRQQSSRNQRTVSIKENIPYRSKSPIQTPIQKLQSPTYRSKSPVPITQTNTRGRGSVSPLRCHKNIKEPHLQEMVDNLKQNILRDIQEVTKKYQSNTPQAKPIEIMQKQNEKIKHLLDYKEPTIKPPYLYNEQIKIQEFKKQQLLEEQSQQLYQQIEMIKQQSLKKQISDDRISFNKANQFKFQDSTPHLQQQIAQVIQNVNVFYKQVQRKQSIGKPITKATDETDEFVSQATISNLSSIVPMDVTNPTNKKLNVSFESMLENQQFDFLKGSDCRNTFGPAQLETALKSPKNKFNFTYNQNSPCQPDFDLNSSSKKSAFQSQANKKTPELYETKQIINEQVEISNDEYLDQSSLNYQEIESHRDDLKQQVFQLEQQVFPYPQDKQLGSIQIEKYQVEKQQVFPYPNQQLESLDEKSHKQETKASPSQLRYNDVQRESKSSNITPLKVKTSESEVPQPLSNKSNRYDQLIQNFQSIKNQAKTQNYVIETKKSVQMNECNHISDFIIYSNTQRESIQEIMKKLVTFQEVNASQDQFSKPNNSHFNSLNTQNTLTQQPLIQTHNSQQHSQSVQSTQRQIEQDYKSEKPQRTTSFSEFLKEKNDVQPQQVKEVQFMLDQEQKEKEEKLGYKYFDLKENLKPDKGEMRFENKQPEVRFDLKSDFKTDYKSDLRTDLKSELRPTELKQEIRPELKSDFRSEHRLDLKPELKSEFRSEHRIDLKPELRSESRTDQRAHLRLEQRTDLKPELRQDPRPELRQDPRPEIKTEIRFELKPPEIESKKPEAESKKPFIPQSASFKTGISKQCNIIGFLQYKQQKEI
ncbi:hypothetical protein pb186bvf_020611 [Paramecium bursaria]